MTEVTIAEIKHIMQILGRSSHLDGEVRGSHLSQILEYLRQTKHETVKRTLSKLSLICAMSQRSIRENYLEGLIEFGIIKTEQNSNELCWSWIGEKAFERDKKA